MYRVYGSDSRPKNPEEGWYPVGSVHEHPGISNRALAEVAVRFLERHRRIRVYHQPDPRRRTMKLVINIERKD